MRNKTGTYFGYLLIVFSIFYAIIVNMSAIKEKYSSEDLFYGYYYMLLFLLATKVAHFLICALPNFRHFR